MNRTVFTALALLWASLAAAEVYKWVDDKGRVHYGDLPPPGMEQPADLPGLQIMTPGPKGKAGPKDLASCLGDKGFRFYGASWCGACRHQLKLFGPSAARLPYIECSEDGKRKGKDTATCIAQGIKQYPTWVFPGGQREAGVYSPRKLAAISGCGAAS